MKNQLDEAKVHPWVLPGIIETKTNDPYIFIAELVCKKYEVKIKDVFSRSRKREFCFSRQIIMSLIRKFFPRVPLAKVGNFCGGKDHATVLHACRTVQNIFDTNLEFKEIYTRFCAMIRMNLDMLIIKKNNTVANT
jgi:chromosomal replication initiator protein